MSNVVHHMQPSFAGGELSPGLYSRVDTQRYMSGLKTARNACILPQGGVRNRAGTYKVQPAYDSSKVVRIKDFVYSTGKAFAIEFGDGYIRFFTNDACVADPNAATAPDWTYPTSYNPGDYVKYDGHAWLCISHDVSSEFNFPGSDPAKWVISDFYKISSPYTSDEIFDLKFTSSADNLYIFHPSHRTQVLKRNSDSDWDISDFDFERGPFMLMNTATARTITPSAAQPTKQNKTISYIGSSGSGPYVLYIDLSTATTLKTGDSVSFSGVTGSAAFLNGNTYTAVVISTSRVKLYYPGTYNFVTYPTLVGYAPAAGTLSYQVPITLTTNFDIFDANHVGALFQLTDTVASNSVTLSAAGGYTDALQCGSTFHLITNDISANTPWTGEVTVFMSTDNGATWNKLMKVTSVPSGTISQNHDVSGETGATQCLVRAYINSAVNGCKVTLESPTFDWVSVVKMVSVTNPRSATANIVDYTGIGTGIANLTAKFQWAEGSWSDYRGWPAVGSFFQDRFVAASTESEPETLWMSQTGDYKNFGMSPTVTDSDAITVVLNSRTINTIRNLSALTGLVVNTSDSDFSVAPASGAITPTSIEQICQGHRGSSKTTPVVIGNELLLVQPMGTTVRNLIYQFAVQGYMGDNVSVMSQHLFSGHNIVEMAYQQEPDSIVWAVRDDGVLLSLSYMREQEVCAWTRHDTDGVYESVCCIPNETLGINEVWFVVKRTINGSDVRFIERMAARDMGDDPADYMMLDCAVSVTNVSPSASVTGLSHLEGKTVNALADGNVVRGLTVTGGAVTLPVAATKIHVGLPYVSDVETLPIELQAQDGTSQGRRTAIPRATFRVWNSRGGYYRTTSQESVVAATGVAGFDELKERTPSADLSVSLPLVTRDYLVPLNGGYNFRTSIMFRQVDPLPFCITAIIPQAAQGGN